MKGKYLFMRGLRSYSAENHHRLIPPPLMCACVCVSTENHFQQQSVNTFSLPSVPTHNSFFFIPPYYYYFLERFSNHCVYVPIYLRLSSGKSKKKIIFVIMDATRLMGGPIFSQIDLKLAENSSKLYHIQNSAKLFTINSFMEG